MNLSNSLVYFDDVKKVLDTLPNERVGEVYQEYQAFKQRLSEWEDLFVAGLIQYIAERGDLPIQTIDGIRRVYNAIVSTTKCRDVKALFYRLLEQEGPEAVARALSSGAFKHGALKPVLGDEWDQHFEVEITPKLAEGGAGRKTLRVTRTAEDAEIGTIE